MNLVPQHVAIIMDGNGRWGLKNKGNRISGHKAGLLNIEKIIDTCVQEKIKIITFYSFSFDNWKRSKNEVYNLFRLFKNFYKLNFNKFIKNNIIIKIIGENKSLPKSVLTIKKKINKSKIKNFILKINVALNYSSKLEILNSIKKSKILNLNNIEKNLYTYPDPDPDIIIRTGGRYRLSDFLLWQGSYSELFFSKKLWPDFSINDFKDAIKWYKKVKRNFGSIQ